MTRAVRFLAGANLLLAGMLLVGCETPSKGIDQARAAVAASIASESPGNYYIGRRYYKPDFKFWGYVRKPGQPWSSAELVMMNEKQKLAPDRQANAFGSDNNYEYKLIGSFSGEKVYEPASNTIYPEFVLKDYQVISTNPPPIFPSQLSGRAQGQTSRLTIEKPQPQF